MANQALIALGGNLPDGDRSPAETLRAALRRLRELGLAPISVSRFHATPCFPAGAGPDYVNAAAVVECGPLTAAEVLATLHRVEAEFGRERLSRWAGRTLDLDLLAMGGQVLPDAATQAEWRDLPPEAQARRAPDSLILPHPRLQDRGFVLVPLADVAPDWCHPVLGLTVRQMLARLPAEDLAGITLI
ncbi:2-amino-4-hydroxy-6-hydroxymethyldihydropteridine diphosphokinase [Gemmobacter lutimaris]|uniref:2-amino-4-hydroxy-6-hydroxymethyldihydropteridine pyrophosphokinase n=1 Tax=Gemmobacter lutimaris TaxID=2306023 RepID=A0A398BYZ9_9RHOB|nr:2-amino-4-hydroxy-6-hydroxymethyldihydropteridine diphosphokinase [Gemmobacter lutimaris]RID93170.1 2-amino-4-hydroxy-6-hydroxymethyldihydropteridine diphosphokinase [Gemmobacter lutimaris]